MAFSKTSDRQYVLSARADFTYADFTSGTELPVIELPPDAVVVGGQFVVTTVWDSATSDTFTVGDETDDDEYGAAIDGQAAALTALVPTGFEYTATEDVVVKWTGVGTAPTQGAGYLIVNYVRDGRSNENQG